MSEHAAAVKAALDAQGTTLDLSDCTLRDLGTRYCDSLGSVGDFIRCHPPPPSL